jgi:FSR family fosmidomycin resistance protein-like MFS transporter
VAFLWRSFAFGQRDRERNRNELVEKGRIGQTPRHFNSIDANSIDDNSSSVSSSSRTAFAVLVGLSFCHLLNDLLQSLLPALYPMLKSGFGLDFWQIGLITFTNAFTASLLQPVVGYVTDRRPQPFSLAAGMSVTMVGLLLLAFASGFGLLLVAAGLIGVGSAIFHPESSRIARLASGGRHGLAQSLFQTGGNFGSSLGPLLAAFIVLPRGQQSVAWFSFIALAAIPILYRIGLWYRAAGRPTRLCAVAAPMAAHTPAPPAPAPARLPRPAVKRALALLLMLVFSKYVYLSSLTSYYTFFLIHRFNVSVSSAQIYLFIFLGAVAAGTFIGGPVGDRFGRKYVIWGSIFGVLPFTLALPYVSLFWTAVLSAVIGIVLASAFSAILVFAQELVPGRVGLVAGLFFGFAFGIGGLGAAILGRVADATGIEFVYRVCAFLPAIGIVAFWLPDPRQAKGPGPKTQ